MWIAYDKKTGERLQTFEGTYAADEAYDWREKRMLSTRFAVEIEAVPDFADYGYDNLLAYWKPIIAKEECVHKIMSDGFANLTLATCYPPRITIHPPLPLATQLGSKPLRARVYCIQVHNVVVESRYRGLGYFKGFLSKLRTVAHLYMENVPSKAMFFLRNKEWQILRDDHKAPIFHVFAEMDQGKAIRKAS